MENSVEVLRKLETELPCDPAVPLLDIYLKEMKTLTQKGTCTPKFGALFTIAKIWKQSRCPLITEWIKKVCVVCVYVYVYIYVYDIILFDCKKERNPAICSNIDGP